MECLYKFVLTLNSISWMFVIYSISKQWSFMKFPVWVSGILLLLIPVLLSLFSIFLAKGLGNDSLKSCQECSLADNEFIPTYLGYFFVSLSTKDNVTMIFMYVIVFMFTCLSQTQYFNPLYLLFGYHYYHVLTEQGTRIFVIVSGPVIRNKKDMSFGHLKRINDTTYLVMKGNKDESSVCKN